MTRRTELAAQLTPEDEAEIRNLALNEPSAIVLIDWITSERLATLDRAGRSDAGLREALLDELRARDIPASIGAFRWADVLDAIDAALAAIDNLETP